MIRHFSSPIARLRIAIVFAIVAGVAPSAGLGAAAALVGPPPPDDSAIALADRAAMAAPVTPERLALASRDQALAPFLAFGEIVGPGFVAADLPATTELLAIAYTAALAAVNPLKLAYPRQRPFVTAPDLARCSHGPAGLAPDQSYPSGHAAIGMAWAMVLGELLPAQAAELARRGEDYGASRVICGVHWPSDVAAGGAVGAAAARALIADARLVPALEAARHELDRLGARAAPLP